MAATTIFPGLSTDIDNTILYYMTPRARDLVDLSGTHKFAYNKLSNGKYFQQLFAGQHPLLAKTDHAFLQLRTHYLDCCWKVACCSMLKDYTPFKMEFLHRPVLALTSAYNQEKEGLLAKKQAEEFELKRICGSCYQDPGSPIHQAWEASIKEHSQYENFLIELQGKLKVILSRFDHSIEFCIDKLKFLPNINSEELSHEKKLEFALGGLFGILCSQQCLDLLSEDIAVIQQHPAAQVLDLNRIEEYRAVVPVLLELKKTQEMFSQNRLNLIEKYHKLEENRKCLVNGDQAYSNELVRIEKNLTDVWRSNHLLLLVDQYFARNAEKMLGVDFLCTHFDLTDININHFSNGAAKTFRGSAQEFKDSLNGCEESSLIWEMLYHQCANGVHEDQWAEKHFHQFPHEYAEIMTRLQSLAKCFKSVYLSSIDLKTYVDKHFDAMKGSLNYLIIIKVHLMQQLQEKSQSHLCISRYRLDASIFKLLNISSNLQEVLPIVSTLIELIESHEE